MNARAFRIAVGIHSMAILQVKDVCGEERTCALHAYPKARRVDAFFVQSREGMRA
jgi:hypothetical protein